MKLLTVILCLICCVSYVFAQANEQISRDPEKAQFVTSDIDNFWRAYDLARDETDNEKKIAIFQTEYLDKGSIGLKDFVRLRIKSAKNLVNSINARPKYYVSIRPATLRVKEMEKRMRKSFRNLKKIYPDAVFPNVYFTIGVLNSGGTTSENGLLIGTEMYGLTPQTPRDELDNWLKAVLSPIENLPFIVAHESIHYQQNFPEPKTLLGKSIQEGMCDFIAELIAGKHANQVQKAYGEAHEAALWKEFQPEMQGKDLRRWMYNGVNAKDRPADLGYYVGYKIVQSYYNQTKDKKQAIKEMLNLKDIQAFFEASRYGKKFTE